MSKTYDRLKKINNRRIKDDMRMGERFIVPGVAMLKNNSGKITSSGAKNNSGLFNNNLLKDLSDITSIAIFTLIIICVTLVVLFTRSLFVIGDLRSWEISSARKLVVIEELLKKNSLRLEEFSKDFNAIKEDIKVANQKAKVALEKMEELEKKADGQSFVINNLVKAKDQLFSRIAQLEATK